MSQAQRGYYYVRNLVCLVQNLDRRRKGIDIGYSNFGKRPGVNTCKLDTRVVNKCGTYSASNWFGKMRSASRNRALYSGTSSSGM